MQIRNENVKGPLLQRATQVLDIRRSLHLPSLVMADPGTLQEPPHCAAKLAGLGSQECTAESTRVVHITNQLTSILDQ